MAVRAETWWDAVLELDEVSSKGRMGGTDISGFCFCNNFWSACVLVQVYNCFRQTGRSCRACCMYFEPLQCFLSPLV